MFLIYFVGSEETENFDNGVKQPFRSYYFSCGDSPWEGDAEKREGDSDNITADGDAEELETINNSKTPQMVTKHSFLHIISYDTYFSILTCTWCKLVIFVNTETCQLLFRLEVRSCEFSQSGRNISDQSGEWCIAVLAYIPVVSLSLCFLRVHL